MHFAATQKKFKSNIDYESQTNELKSKINSIKKKIIIIVNFD